MLQYYINRSLDPDLSLFLLTLYRFNLKKLFAEFVENNTRLKVVLKDTQLPNITRARAENSKGHLLQVPLLI